MHTNLRFHQIFISKIFIKCHCTYHFETDCILLNRGLIDLYFRMELDSFFKCAEVGAVLFDFVESELEKFELVELKNNSSDFTTLVETISTKNI